MILEIGIAVGALGAALYGLGANIKSKDLAKRIKDIDSEIKGYKDQIENLTEETEVLITANSEHLAEITLKESKIADLNDALKVCIDSIEVELPTNIEVKEVPKKKRVYKKRKKA